MSTLSNPVFRTTTAVSSAPVFTSSTIENDSSSTSSYLTTSNSSIVACLTLMIALMYLVVLSWGYRFARQNAKPLNKGLGYRVQRYAPLGYVFLVLSSLTEVAFASWLAIQYHFNHNYPRVQTRTGVGLLLFASTWTFVTAVIYNFLFLHPRWSKHSISSIGAQAIWLFITWLFWVVGAIIVNSSIPKAINKSQCEGIVYCVQLRLLFAVAVVDSLALTAGVASLLWLAWQSTRAI